jgi:hypothetical protein
VKRLHSPDVYDLSKYVPDDPEHFGILVQVMVCPVGEDDVDESFDTVVCTPSWLSTRLGSTDIELGRHYTFVKQYDFVALTRFIEDFAAQCVGTTWDEVALRLGRLGKWEFEDYQE